MFENVYAPTTGSFLVAEPFLGDRNFRRTVILLAESTAEGNFGFVLNRPLDLQLNDVMDGVPHFEAPLYLGGPVDHNSLHFIHRIPDLDGCRQIGKNVYWSGDFAHLCRKIERGEVKTDDVMFFIGYSGWGKGQLEQEINLKSWIVAPQNDVFLFPVKPKNIWSDILKTMGKTFSLMANYPPDPRLN